MAESPFTTPTRFIELPDTRVPYYRVGRGPDLLFVHGWPLHAATFRHLVAGLQDRFTCHLIDLPGAGQSEWSTGEVISSSAHPRTIGQVARALGLESYGLVAHDSGALFARVHAAEAGEKVKALVVIGSEIPGHHPWQLGAYGVVGRLFGAEGFRTFFRVGPLRRSFLGFGGAFTDGAYADGEFYDIFLRPLVDDPRKLKGALRLLVGFTPEVVDQLAEVHTRITAPTLLVWGDKDPFFPLKKARQMADQFPAGARLEVIPGARIFPHEDRAEEVLTHVRPMLLEHLDTEDEVLKTKKPLDAATAPASGADRRPSP